VNTICGLLTSPEGEPVAAIAACYNGSLKEGDKVLRSIKSFGPPLADHISPDSKTMLILSRAMPAQCHAERFANERQEKLKQVRCTGRCNGGEPGQPAPIRRTV
jgi:hypothetical protein